MRQELSYELERAIEAVLESLRDLQDQRNQHTSQRQQSATIILLMDRKDRLQKALRKEQAKQG